MLNQAYKDLEKSQHADSKSGGRTSAYTKALQKRLKKIHGMWKRAKNPVRSGRKLARGNPGGMIPAKVKISRDGTVRVFVNPRHIRNPEPLRIAFAGHGWVVETGPKKAPTIVAGPYATKSQAIKKRKQLQGK
jgi:hypothetical protein